MTKFISILLLRVVLDPQTSKIYSLIQNSNKGNFSVEIEWLMSI